MPPWEMVEGGPPKMWGNGSVVSWNDATYKMLGEPQCIELLYDEAGGRLGFRGVYHMGAIRVRQTDALCCAIEIDEYLDKLDLSLPNEWEATPELEKCPTAPGTPHQQCIVWIAIPE